MRAEELLFSIALAGYDPARHGLSGEGFIFPDTRITDRDAGNGITLPGFSVQAMCDERFFAAKNNNIAGLHFIEYGGFYFKYITAPQIRIHALPSRINAHMVAALQQPLRYGYDVLNRFTNGGFHAPG